MAKVEGPLFSKNVEGSIGGMLTFRNTKGTHTIRKKNIPPVYQTPAALKVKGTFREAIDHWNELTDQEKEWWNRKAGEHGGYMWGRCKFMSKEFKRLFIED